MCDMTVGTNYFVYATNYCVSGYINKTTRVLSLLFMCGYILFYNNLLNITITFFDYIIYDLYDIKYDQLSNITFDNFIEIKKEILNYLIITLKQLPIIDELKLETFIDLLINNNNMSNKLLKIDKIEKIVKFVINKDYMKGLLCNNINILHIEIIIQIIEIAYRGINK